MKPLLYITVLILSFPAKLWGQAIAETSQWSRDFQQVEIESKLDGKWQKAMYRKSAGNKKMPLLISLHSWSGDYTQLDSLAFTAVEKNWNYIHPDFRGANNSYEACGSALALGDIDDAIDFALAQGNIDLNNIHVVGSSGGGHATLLSYMKSRHDIKSFSAWVPISNLNDWYFESLGRQQKYATEILLSTKSKADSLNHNELNLRSPIFMETPLEQRKNSRLAIYAGIHDGYLGSVPISHSLLFYNKIVADMGGTSDDLVSSDIILDLIKMRTYPKKTKQQLGGRDIIFEKHFQNISVVIFEGKHEMLVDAVWERLLE
jgi:pimeloyl-ACP methyl ester carboxylesterase